MAGRPDEHNSDSQGLPSSWVTSAAYTLYVVSAAPMLVVTAVPLNPNGTLLIKGSPRLGRACALVPPADPVIGLRVQPGACAAAVAALVIKTASARSTAQRHAAASGTATWQCSGRRGEPGRARTLPASSPQQQQKLYTISVCLWVHRSVTVRIQACRQAGGSVNGGSTG